MGEPCPLCGQEMVGRRKPMLLYNHHVCKKCYYGLANRRQAAFVVDWVGLQIMSIIVVAVGAVVLSILGTDEQTLDGATTLLSWAVLPVFLCKDGLGGVSPGKALMGVRVVDTITGQRGGFGTSFKRNLPIMVPFMPLIIACTLAKGERIGDGWAHSMVVWNKYADSPVFSTKWPSVPTPEVAPAPLPVEEPIVEDGNPYRPPPF